MKKIISTALSVIMLASPLTVFAETVSADTAAVAYVIPNVEETDYSSAASDDKALEQAILTVKSRINIPPEYETFTFNKYAQYGTDFYYLSWDRSDIYGHIDATVTADGILLSCNHYTESENSKAHFAKLSVNSLYNKAVSYMKQLNPDIYGNIDIDKDSYYAYISSKEASFSLARKEKGILVNGDTGTIRLNKDTGELSSFYISWAAGFKGKDTSELLTQSRIKSQYSKLIGLEPYYRINTNADGSKKIVLLYRQKTSDALDAFTGKISSFNSNYYGGGIYGDGATGEASADMNPRTGGGEVSLSPAELKAVETEKGLISAESAAKIIFNEKYNAINADEMELQSSYLNQYDGTEKYVWSLSFKKTNQDYSSLGAMVDAADGGILSFYDYTYIPYTTVNASEKKFSEKTSDANVTAALKSYLGEKFSEYKLKTGSVTYTSNNIDTSSNLKSGKSYQYSRYVNGIVVDNDYIRVQTNYEGKLTNFYYNYTDIEFPFPAKILTEAKALNSLYKQQDLTLGYSLNLSNSGKVTSALVYKMPEFTIDAFTGKIVNWDGSEISNGTGYSDLGGHSAKAMVEKLSQNGISLSAIDGKLMPDSKISEGDFINLVSQISTDWNDFYYGYQTKLYDSSRATIAKLAGTASSVSASSNTVLTSPVTRQEAVKCMITALGGKKFAELKGIYSSPYKDVAKDSEYAGYFALADGMGIIKANSSGGINPKTTITRAQALLMVYNYLSNN